MKNNKNKTLTTIAMILTLTSIMLTAMPTAFASYTKLPGYTPMPDRDTQTEVAVSPTLVGLGQQVLINIIIYPGPSGPTYEAQYLVGGLTGGFRNVSITITHPDGTKETFKPIDETLEKVGIKIPGLAQIVGHLQFYYKPTKTGTYTLNASFPGQFYTTDNISPTAKLSVYYKPSKSTKPATFTVQEKEVLAGILNGWPWQPLPKNYWENPVQTDNREWAAISGDWLQKAYDSWGSKYNPYTTAPNSPHIIWKRQLEFGGLAGGMWGSLPYDSGRFFFTETPIVLNGKIYRNTPKGTFECIDLRTGEKYWEAQGTIYGGQHCILPWQTAAQTSEGYLPCWLWGGFGTDTWYRYDPYDGRVIHTIKNAPTDISDGKRAVKFQEGTPIVWVVQANLALWNKTKPLKLPYVNLIKWNLTKMITTIVYAQVYSNNWKDGIEWNVSAQTGDLVDIGDNNFRGPTVYPYYGAGVVIVRTPNAMQIMAGFDMKTGKLLWKNNATVLNIDVLSEGIATSPYGPHIMQDGASPNWVAYDVKTGKEVWRAPSGELPWGALPSYECIYHNGVHFLGSYDGHVYAYNSTNGKLVWKSDYIGESWEYIYGNAPITAYDSVGADGKLYFCTSTVYRMMPRTRFHVTICIDEATGKILWKLPIGIEPFAVADGYLAGQDQDNGIMYVIGKGKTRTTVSVQNDVATAGSGVLIKGSVMDMSPGAPNTPAVSDADMSVWMDYLYGQNATLLNDPPKPNGVPVSLYAIDANGAQVHIADVTTDWTGTFKTLWTPENPGVYTIIAVFAGSESYWTSYGATAIGVTEAPVQPEAPQAPAYNTIDLVIIAAVAVVAVLVVYTIYTVRKLARK